MTPKIIAFYLPQYHPTPHNDEWWGPGFTEWTNVAKARPLFKGHHQPNIPADLGFYDLRLPETRRAQADMARKYGVDGFCYYHYWFGEGRRELERPFQEVLESGEPDFPFMLCWANESWAAKFWNPDGSKVERKILAEQTYSDEDTDRHFMELLSAFRDKRYIKIDGRPAFMVYKPLMLPDAGKFISRWQQLAKENGLPGIYFLCQLQLDITDDVINRMLEEGFDAVNTCRLFDIWVSKRTKGDLLRRAFDKFVRRIPGARAYAEMYPRFLEPIDRTENVVPTLIPNWDHTPRSGMTGTVLTGTSPELFHEHCIEVLGCVAEKKENPLVFLKSWNEWGEGNYMEPDTRHGHGFLAALLQARNETVKTSSTLSNEKQ